MLYLPNLSYLHVITTEILQFLYNRVKSFSVGRTSVLRCDLKYGRLTDKKKLTVYLRFKDKVNKLDANGSPALALVHLSSLKVWIAKAKRTA